MSDYTAEDLAFLIKVGQVKPEEKKTAPAAKVEKE